MRSVVKPNHYRRGGIESIDVVEQFDLNFRLGNVVKYVLRHQFKNNPEEDLQKALWYLTREIVRRSPEGRERAREILLYHCSALPRPSSESKQNPESGSLFWLALAGLIVAALLLFL